VTYIAIRTRTRVPAVFRALALALTLTGQAIFSQSPAPGVPQALAIAPSQKPQAIALSLESDSLEVEVGKSIHLSAGVTLTRGQNASFSWAAEKGGVTTGRVAGEADYVAPDTPGSYTVTVTASAPGLEAARQSVAVTVLPAGALQSTVPVVVEVDTNTLKGVWVNADHPRENFKGPLKIKGTFRYDPATGDAFAGGSWPVYDMRDDGKDGDRKRRR